MPPFVYAQGDMATSTLVFSVPGTPRSTPGAGGTLKGLERTAELGLKGMEIEWVQQVPKNVEQVKAVGKKAKELGITLTIHAPYYVNLNSPEPPKRKASIERCLLALRMAQHCGAVSVCVHAAFNLGKAPEDVYKNVSFAVEEILSHKKDFPDVNLGLETMGKHSQFGTLEECLRISKDFGIYPTVDPAHLHARTNGGFNTTKEWNDMFDLYEKVLGKKSLSHMHLHYSGIAYTDKGERHHLPLEQSDARWRDFLAVLKKRGIGGVCVCESPEMEDDTLLMQQTYERLK